ncbi:DUF4192 domain-containing protein [Nocardiopsis coralliicola]
MDTSASGNSPGPLLRRIDDLVSTVPYLVGYHPSDAVAVLGVAGGRIRFCLCTTPPLPDPRRFAERAARALAERECDAALAVGYGSAAGITPRMDALRAALDGSGTALRDAVRVTEGRFWSYLCSNPACCPPEGRRVDPARSPAAAEAVVAGLHAWPDRAALCASVAPAAGEARARMARATAAVEARSARLYAAGPRAGPGHGAFPGAFRAAGMRALDAAVRRGLAGRGPGSEYDVAWLALGLVCVPVRDAAWLRITRADARAHVALWRSVFALAQPAYAAAPGALLGFSAWLADDPALADAALERVLHEHPRYTMAQLVRGAVECGVSPRRWVPPPALRRSEKPPPRL